MLYLVLMGCSGCERGPLISIEEVVDLLVARDGAIDNFCSDVTFVAVRPGVAGEPIQRTGVRCYEKPDVSVLCLAAARGEAEFHGEIGRQLYQGAGRGVTAETLQDSFFLRDLRSIAALRTAHAFPAQEPGTPLRFYFEPGQTERRTRSDKGRYTIAVEAAGYEKAILQVDVTTGAILEKTVYRPAERKEIAREVHRDFVSLAGAPLPTRTVYDYGGQRVTVSLFKYRVNLPIDFKRFASGVDGCSALQEALRHTTESVHER